MLKSDADFKAALDADQEEAQGPALIQPWAPYDVAKIFLERHVYEGFTTIRYHQSKFYSWRGNAYREMDENDVRALLYDFLDSSVQPDKKSGDPVPVKPCPALVSAVLDGLRAAANIDLDTAAPAWLVGDKWQPPAHEIMACENGLLHLPTKTLLKGTPAFFTYNARDFAYNPKAPEPVLFIEFLKQLWPEDVESVETLQQIFGLLILPDTTFQKAFLVVGPKRSGKGTIARVLNRLLGKGNICAPKLKDLGDGFGREQLIGKLVAIVSDARLKGKVDKHAIAEELLSITGEDCRSINRKHIRAWIGQLFARFIIFTNELPQIEDSSGALASRFIVLALKQSFYGREDRELASKLYAEMAGILNWAIAGWEKLKKAGRFSQPAASAAAIQKLEDMGSPIATFVRDNCEMGGPDYSVEKDVLFTKWLNWCADEGRTFAGTREAFGRDLYAAFPEIDIGRPRASGGSRLRVYTGIKLIGAK